MLRSTTALLPTTFFLCLAIVACDDPDEAGTEAPPALPPPVPEGLAALVPADAFCFIEFESLNALDLCARDLIGVFDTAKAEAFGMGELLAQMFGPEESFEFIDPTRPVGLAWSLPEGHMIPLPTLIATFAPGDHVIADIVAQTRCPISHFQNGWLALSQHDGYAALGAPNELTSDLPRGQVRARINLRHVIDTYRDVIEAGLDQAEMQIDRMADDPAMGGFDLVSIMELYFEGIRLFLDGVDQVEVAAQIAGTEVGFETWLDVLEDSPLAVASAGEPTDLPEIAHTVDPSAAMVMFLALDWDRAMTWLEPSLDTIVGFYPEDFGQLMKAQIESYSELYPLLGNSLAASGGFGPGGMRFAYTFDSTDAEAYIDGYVEMMEAKLPEVSGFEIDGPYERTVGDVEVVEYTTIIGEEFYGLMLGQDVEDLTEEEIAAMRPSMDAMYGPNGLLLRLATSGKRLSMVMGGDDDWFTESYQRLENPEDDLPPALDRALERVGRANPAIVAHIDLARMFTQVWESIRELPGAERPDSLAEFDGVSVPLTFWSAVDGPEWRGGAVFDLARIADLMEAVDKIEERKRIEIEAEIQAEREAEEPGVLIEEEEIEEPVTTTEEDGQ